VVKESADRGYSPEARSADVIAILALLVRPFEATGATPFREELESAIATVSRQLADQ
jgi:hypothetical protein